MSSQGKSSSDQEIFISYTWGGESEAIVNNLVDKIGNALERKNIRLIRDKTAVTYKDNIRAFMEQLGRGAAVIVVISDKYLKSEYCMFELVEIASNGDFYDRIFPIVLPDAQIYKAIERLRYIKYWEREIKDLDQAMREVGQANLQGIRESIDLYTKIRNTIAKLTDTIKDMNTLSSEIHTDSGFSELMNAIEQKLDSGVQQPSPKAFAPLPTQLPTSVSPLVTKVNTSFAEQLGNNVTLDMVYVPGGYFWMGSPDTENKLSDSEGPQHRVDVPGFYMGKYPITQRQWYAVSLLDEVDIPLNPYPSHFKGDDLPVEQVNWYEAVEFCKRLTEYTAKRYRLPTEAEWEYACRAGTTTPFYFGESISTDQANYDGNYIYGSEKKGIRRGHTTPVDNFSPNKFDLYDMHGNVWEWCLEHWYNNYDKAPDDNSDWVTSDETASHVTRGGSWINTPGDCCSACRDNRYSDDCLSILGFRIVCSAPRIPQ